MPAAVAEAIAVRTGVNPTGITRRARAGACRRCYGRVLRGLDDDVAAFTATADPWPLTGVGELQALLQGRSTYALYGKPPSLDIRDPWQIKGRPADTVVVLAEHRCGTPPLPAREIEGKNPPAIPSRSGAHEPPPF